MFQAGTLTYVWSMLLFLHNSAEDVMRTAYKTITPSYEYRLPDAHIKTGVGDQQ